MLEQARSLRGRSGLRVQACLECSKRMLAPPVRPRPCINMSSGSSVQGLGSSSGPQGPDSDKLPSSARAQPGTPPGKSNATPLDQSIIEGSTSTSASADSSTSASASQLASTTKEDDSPAVRAALAALGFYRNVLSPMMPSSCRYLPTCSQYSIDSYKKFGLWKGTVLTAWRIMRCNPLGSSGYDPPAWPPVGWLGALYQEGSWDYAPQVTVVVGSALFIYVANELISELLAIL